MKTFYVSVVVYRPNATGFNIQNKIYTVDAVSEDEARGKTLTQYQEDFPGYVLSTMLSFEKEDASKNVWQQVVDEALVVAHIGIANNDATFDEAKKKLNDLICHSIDIDRYFLAEEKKEQLLKSKDSLSIWLWSELMDYIKSRDIPSDMQNKLFKIMERAKHVFDSSAQAQQPVGQVKHYRNSVDVEWFSVPDDDALLYLASPAPEGGNDESTGD